MLIDGDSFCASQLHIVLAWCGPQGQPSAIMVRKQRGGFGEVFSFRGASKLLDARFTTYQPPGDSDSRYSVVGTIWCESTMR
jgi:hypothetical protein